MRSLMFRVVQLFCAMLAVVIGVSTISSTPAQAATADTKSWYVSSLSGMYSKGSSVCSQKGYLVLDFGQAIKQGSAYGTWSATNTFWSTADIETAVKQFLDGYTSCASTSSLLRVAVGTSNYRGNEGLGTTTTDSLGHANAWAAMVNDLDSYVSTQSYGAKVGVAGGIDAELAWNYSGDTTEWAVDFSTAVNTTVFYYDYGDAAGCPPSGSCDNGWSQEGVYQMAWGYNAALPLPEIYNQAMADEWEQIALYGLAHWNSKMLIKAVMSQHQACVEQGYPTTAVPSCSGTFFTTAEAWNAMENALNGDPTTAQTIPGTTDIRNNW